MTIFWIFAGLSLAGLVVYLLQILSARSYRVRSTPPPSVEGSSPSLPAFFPPVSILKPLKGLDDNLFDNLASFCMLDYPCYEIIFSLQHRNDQAYKVACMVKERFPEQAITILVEPCNAGLNPKVNNLMPAYRIARHDVILISDSNVMVSPSYLRDITPHLADPSVGLVSNLIRGMGGHSLGARLENLHLNTFVMGSVCFLDRFLKMPCVVGKSMLMRKADLDSVGGFEGVKDVLAEDYMLGRKMSEGGKKVVLSGHMINNVNDYWGVRKFLNRHTRWGKLRWQIGGPAYFSELLGNPVFMACMPLILLEPSKITMALAAGVGTAKAVADACFARMIRTDMSARACILSPVKDIIIGILWFVPLLSSTVTWRGNRYIIGKDSRLSPCPERTLTALPFRLARTIRARFA